MIKSKQMYACRPIRRRGFFSQNLFFFFKVLFDKEVVGVLMWGQPLEWPYSYNYKEHCYQAILCIQRGKFHTLIQFTINELLSVDNPLLLYQLGFENCFWKMKSKHFSWCSLVLTARAHSPDWMFWIVLTSFSKTGIHVF